MKINKYSDDFKAYFGLLVEDISKFSDEDEDIIYFYNHILCIILRMLFLGANIGEKDLEFLKKYFEIDYTLKEIQEFCVNNNKIIKGYFEGYYYESVTKAGQFGGTFIKIYKELLISLMGIIVNSEYALDENDLSLFTKLISLLEEMK